MWCSETNEDECVRREYKGRTEGGSVRGKPVICINKNNKYIKERELEGKLREVMKDQDVEGKDKVGSLINRYTQGSRGC